MSNNVMTTYCRGEEYLTKLTSLGTKKIESPNKGRLFKCLRDVDKLHASQGVGQWPNNSITLLERNLGEICRILDKQVLLHSVIYKIHQECCGQGLEFYSTGSTSDLFGTITGRTMTDKTKFGLN